jgi:monoamine oxidase
MESKTFDVVVIGAGAAGLLAALEIALTGRTVAVMEAKEKTGGRMFTAHAGNGYPLELGAEFVHGDLPLTKELLKKAGVKTTVVRGSIWQHKNGQLNEQVDFIEDYSDLEKKFKEVKDDMPVADFLSFFLADETYEELRFSLKNYVEGYYAADVERASTFSLRDELMKSDEEQYRMEGGYRQLVNYLERQCGEKGVEFFLSQAVAKLYWKKDSVEVVAAQNTVLAKKALVTVSVGVLQKGGIEFSPALPEKKAAAQKLGFGHAVKIILCFDEPFWKNQNLTGRKNLSDLNFLFSKEEIPTWWTQHTKEEAVLVGWLGGPGAGALATLDEEGMIQKALQSLSQIFNMDGQRLSQKLKSWQTYNWSADPHFYGAYSYEVVNGEACMKIILQPVDDTVYFAGEGLHHGPQIGTVEAALHSGRTVAQQLIAGF